MGIINTSAAVIACVVAYVHIHKLTVADPLPVDLLMAVSDLIEPLVYTDEDLGADT